jgi:hypothetical protein
VDNSLTEEQFELQNKILLFCKKSSTLYQDVQVFIEENFDIELCSFENNGIRNEIGEADLICKHLLVCKLLEIPKDKSLTLLKEYSNQTNIDLHGNRDIRHPNIAAIFMGNMESIFFSKPIDQLIKIRSK